MRCDFPYKSEIYPHLNRHIDTTQAVGRVYNGRMKIFEGKKLASHKLMGWVLAALAALGLLASFVLLHETFAVAKNPSYNPSCNINPLVSCSSIMSRPESEILGLPFSAFGAAAFGALLAFAVLLASGAKFKEWIWKAALLAGLGGLGFVGYMLWLSLALFGSICPWCATTWVTTIAIFWTLVTYVVSAGVVSIPKKLRAAAAFWKKNAVMILVAMYVILVFGILLRFNEVLFA